MVMDNVKSYIVISKFVFLMFKIIITIIMRRSSRLPRGYFWRLAATYTRIITFFASRLPHVYSSFHKAALQSPGFGSL